MTDPLRTHLEKVIALTDAEFELVRSLFVAKRYRKHQFLIQEGEPVPYVYFIVSGLVKLGYADTAGKQHIISFAMEDWWESDFQAFYTQSRATLTLDCLEDSEVLCLSFENYQKLRTDLRKMEYFLLEKANAGHIAAQRRILSLLTTNAKERYEQLLQQFPSLLQRVPKTLLAAYLGVSRETLSRLAS